MFDVEKFVYGFGSLTIKIIVITLTLIIVVGFITVSCHRHFYPFWKTQPVAWTTITKSKRGIITDHIPTPIEIPDNYHLIYTSKNVKTICELLNRDYLRKETHFKLRYTEPSIQILVNDPQSGCNLLYHNSEPIGCIFYRAFTFTDMGQQIPAFWIDKLCIDSAYRGKHLSSVLISNTVSHQQTLQKEPIVAIFHRESRLPFPEMYATVNYQAVINTAILNTADGEGQLVHPTIKELIDFEKVYNLSNQATLGTMPYVGIEANRELWENVILKDKTNVILLYKSDGIHFVYLQKMPLEIEENEGVYIYQVVYYFGNKQKIGQAIRKFLLSGEGSEVVLVVSGELTDVFTDQKWYPFDTQYYYMYNYRLNQKYSQKPLLLPFASL